MESIAIEMTKGQQFRSNMKSRWIRFRRLFPHLIWYGQELDVTVTFKEDRLQDMTFSAGNPGPVFERFSAGHLPKVQAMLNEIGIEFDTGQGCEGRDWEWDWSLQGPISVKFRSRAKRPWRRRVANVRN